ncbi:hypothetical protein [Spirochaeta cellobiosiphila]|uniref:hypothetical protein n=1 Tax=Spirochaeta cellobiosiphila TaxID=504483 RepID=UPI0004062163|nr:hypothetical protein [Spirochaeta cellobiosiphila]
MGRFVLLLLVFIVFTGSIHAQDSDQLSKGFDNIFMGDSFELVQQKLTENNLFNYRGSPDVSLLDEPNTTLIECRGFSYINWASFQFIDNKLYIITLELNPEETDHYTMYTTLVRKYGESTELDPEAVRWIGDNIILSLERPLTVKYVDRLIQQQLLQQGRANEAYEDVNKGNFLNKF